MAKYKYKKRRLTGGGVKTRQLRREELERKKKNQQYFKKDYANIGFVPREIDSGDEDDEDEPTAPKSKSNLGRNLAIGALTSVPLVFAGVKYGANYYNAMKTLTGLGKYIVGQTYDAISSRPEVFERAISQTLRPKRNFGPSPLTEFAGFGPNDDDMQKKIGMINKVYDATRRATIESGGYPPRGTTISLV